MPSILDYQAFTTPTGHTVVDDVGGAGGTPLDAAHLNPLRDDAVAYIEDHILNSSNKNQHPTSNIGEIGAGAENLAYANAAGAFYSQAQINAMFRLLIRYILGGTTNANTLTQMITTLLGRSDAASVNLFTLADLIATATPNDTVNTIPKRGAADGEINLRALRLSIPVGSGQPAALTFVRKASQVLPFVVIYAEDGTTVLGQITKDALIQATQGLIQAADPTLTPFGVRAAVSPTVDIAYVGDNGGTLANRYWRVMNSGAMVARLGLWVGPAGAEKQVSDGLGNLQTPLLTRRQHNEFVVTPSASALTFTVGPGKYIDGVSGTPVNKTSNTTGTVTSDATKYVWWAISWQSGGTLRVVANTAGGNTSPGSAVQAAMSNPSDEPIGWLLVPPSVTNLSTATFDDYRGSKSGDGNTGAGGASAAASYVTTAAEATLPGSSTLATALTTALQSQAGNVKPAATQTDLKTLLTGAATPNLILNPQSVIAISGNAASIAVPVGLEIAGEWRYISGTPTVTSNVVSGLAANTVVNLYAERGSTFAGLSTFGLVLSTSAISGTQRLIARYLWDGTTLRPRGDFSPLYQTITSNTKLDRLSGTNLVSTVISATALGTQTFATVTDYFPAGAVADLRGSWGLSGTNGGATTKINGAILLDGAQQGFQFWKSLVASAVIDDVMAIPGKLVTIPSGTHTIAVTLWISTGSTTTISHTFTEIQLKVYSQ